ncbi:hypothetical protein [Sagittula salina]|uniref:Uncharacterized protein n=1 Tax=Sagittula salina TaxID=2820268 RepID=A0A940MN19_9RHOB|nr:hypothetical protein [Sagittula salina]MBP0484511.1 hypothetical protein [Sagittula salina]
MLTWPAYAVPAVYVPDTAEFLARHLVSFDTAQEGDVIAICRDVRHTFQGPYRENETEFVIRHGSGMNLAAFHELGESQKQAMAMAEMLLQGDQNYLSAVNAQIFETMRDSEDTDTYSVFCFPDAIGVLKFPEKEHMPFGTQAWLDGRARLVLRRAPSNHQALARHDALQATVRMWRHLLLLFTTIEDRELAKVSMPCVSCLLDSTGRETNSL